MPLIYVNHYSYFVSFQQIRLGQSQRADRNDEDQHGNREESDENIINLCNSFSIFGHSLRRQRHQLYATKGKISKSGLMPHVHTLKSPRRY